MVEEAIRQGMSLEDALGVFGQGNAEASRMVREAEALIRSAKDKMSLAQAAASEVGKNYERLRALRHLKLLEILEARGLGFCSVECLPDEFPDPKDGVGLHRQLEDQYESLGFFPKENIAYIWYEQEAPNRGTYATGSYRRGLLMQLCPYHMALMPTENHIVEYPYRPNIKPLVLSRVEVRDGKFVSVVNDEVIEARIELKFREEHYELFGFAPLPKFKTLKR